MLWVIGSVVLVCAVATRSGRVRVLLGASIGLAAAVLFVVDMAAWVRVVAALLMACATLAAIPEWRGNPGSRGFALAPAGIALAIACLPASCCAAGAWVTGSWGAFVALLRIAVPSNPAQEFARDCLLVVICVLGCDGARARRELSTSLLGVALTTAACAVAAVRVVSVVAVASLPLETRWSEAPALVNALKLDAGEPLYGPPALLNSYTYSPLLDLLHHVLLAPLHLEVSLLAHRALIVAEQLGAGAVLAWAIGPALARAGWGWPWTASVLIELSLLNFLAAAIHPDHLVLLAFAVAVALLVAEERWRRPLWWFALGAVTPLATSAKLTGIGVGFGLLLNFAMERRWRPAGVVALSLAASAATLPLFDATLGACRFYVVDIQRSHPIELAKLATVPNNPYFLLVAGAVALLAGLWWFGSTPGRRRPEERGPLRLLVLTMVCTTAALPAWLKYAGRDNNLVLPVVGSACAALLGLACHAVSGPRTLHPWLGPAAALLGLSAIAPPNLDWLALSQPVRRDAALIERTVREDDAAGRHTLSLLSMSSLIAAGHRAVPQDRFQSAVELWLGHVPEADLLLAHIEDGRYDTVIVPGAYLRPEATPVGRLDARLRAVLEAHYLLIGPAEASSIGGYEWSLVFRRKSADVGTAR